jgi:hypothetical protein
MRRITLSAFVILIGIFAAYMCSLRSMAATPDNGVASALPVARRCTIEFKRNLVAVSSITPIIGDERNNNVASLTGQLRAQHDHWIVLTVDDASEVWIPEQNVLLIRYK